jgi:uncharacterized protein YbjT (DUF2867 family)
VHCSYDDRTSLIGACEGVDAVFWVTPVTENQIDLALRFVEAAKIAGVRHVVKLSVIGMDQPDPMLIAQWHREMEAMLRESGIAWTSLRPNGFMQNFLTSSAPQADGAMYAPLGAGAVPYIDIRDIADVAVKTLRESGHKGKAYDLTGPEALTMEQVAEILSTVAGRAIRYVDVPEAAARQAMLDAGLASWFVEMILDIQTHARSGRSATVTRTVEQLTGRPATSFMRFALDNATRWTSSYFAA